MSDDVIRGILIERKQRERHKKAVRHFVFEMLGTAAALAGIPFMLALLGNCFI